MKIFSASLPDGYLRGGIVYPVRTDFRVWAKYEGLITDNDIAPDMISEAAVKLIFPHIPPMSKRLWEFISWFYRCGEEPKESKGKSVRAYSLEYDEGYIYAAFLQQYGIDLSAEKELHWWKFSALFRSLRETKFTDIVGWRSAVIDRDTPKSRKKFLYEMQDIFALPETLTDTMRRERAREYLKGGIK